MVIPYMPYVTTPTRVQEIVNEIDKLLEEMERGLSATRNRTEAEALYKIFERSKSLIPRQMEAVWDAGTNAAEWEDE